MIEAVILLVGWIVLIYWLLSRLWRWVVQVPRRRGSNPPAPCPAPPPPPPSPSRRSAWLKSIDNYGNMCPQPTGGRLIRMDRDPGQPSLGLSMDREAASRLDDLERRVAMLETLTRSLAVEINRRRHD